MKKYKIMYRTSGRTRYVKSLEEARRLVVRAAKTFGTRGVTITAVSKTL
jgi:hypothetical protein